MSSRGAVLFLMAVATALSVLPGKTLAVVRASCSESGEIVYRENLSTDTPEKRALISANNPNAMCVFFEASEQARSGPVPMSVPGGASHLPDSILSAAAGRSKVEDKDLAAALSAILGKKPGEGYEPMSTGTPAILGGTVAEPGPKPTGAAPKVVGLALAVFNDVPLSNVMAHWRTMSAGTRMLSRMTPTVTSTGSVTLLSIEGVPDEDVGGVCEEAKEKGAGCLAAY